MIQCLAVGSKNIPFILQLILSDKKRFKSISEESSDLSYDKSANEYRSRLWLTRGLVGTHQIDSDDCPVLQPNDHMIVADRQMSDAFGGTVGGKGSIDYCFRVNQMSTDRKSNLYLPKIGSSD